MTARSFDSIVTRAELEPSPVRKACCLLISFSARSLKCRLIPPAAQPVTLRRADRAMPRRRSGGLGSHRPAELAEGVQRRLQVRRQARRSRRSHPGHLPEDLQGARRPSTGGRTSRRGSSASAGTCASITTAASARSGRRSRATSIRTICSRRRPSAARMPPPSTRICGSCCGMALGKLPATLRTAVVLRDLQELSYQEIADRLDLPEGHREVANQPRAARTRASAEAAAGQTASGAAAGASALNPELLNERHHRPRERHRHRPRRRVSIDVSPALGVLLRGDAAARDRASGR